MIRQRSLRCARRCEALRRPCWRGRRVRLRRMRRAGLATTANEQYGEAAAGMRRRRRRKATLVRSKLPPYCPDARQACGTKNGEQRRSVTADCRICSGRCTSGGVALCADAGRGDRHDRVDCGRFRVLWRANHAGMRARTSGQATEGDGAAECARCRARGVCADGVYVGARRWRWACCTGHVWNCTR